MLNILKNGCKNPSSLCMFMDDVAQKSDRNKKESSKMFFL